jgi:hypothetical protein
VKRWAAACGVWLLIGCGGQEAPPPVESAELGPGVAARVGREEVSVALVSEIARAQGVRPEAARERAISDALFAEAARERFAGTGRIETAERSALARALLEELRNKAREQGPPTDAEVEELTRLRWADLDRPELARTRHVVILVKDPSEREKALDVANRLAKVLSGTKDPAEFEKRASEFDAEGLDKRVETLLPVAVDGRVGMLGAPPGTPPQTFDPVFARAANALADPGDQSPVVESKFGFHIIMLLDKVPANHPTLEERRVVLKDEIFQRRAGAMQNALMDELQAGSKVAVDRAADSLVVEVEISQ